MRPEDLNSELEMRGITALELPAATADMVDAAAIYGNAPGREEVIAAGFVPHLPDPVKLRISSEQVAVFEPSDNGNTGPT